MRLDYHDKTRRFTLTIPRGEQDPRVIQREHGLDMSNPLSTPSQAVLFTGEPYAAAAFWDYASPEARAQLATLHAEIEASWAKESNAHILVPDDQELWPFQKAGVEYALRRTHSLIGDQPGLGKTAQAIAISNEISAKRTLVVCPANIRLQWAKMVRRWSTGGWQQSVYPILSGRHGVHPSANWTIVSYDLARTAPIWRALAKGSYDHLILDEAHYLKTIDTHRTRTIFGRHDGKEGEAAALFTRAARITALTGTPLPNRPREAYTLARGLCFDAIDFVSEDDFRWRFNPSHRTEYEDPRTGRIKVRVDERVGRHGELQARLRGNIMVRREKHGPNGVMQQLKVPRIDLVHVEGSADITRALQVERLLDLDPDNWEGVDFETAGSISTARRIMGEAVAPLAADYIAMCIEGGEEKIVVFAHHIKALDIIQKRLEKYGVLRIDGRTPPARKPKIVDEFIRDPSKRVCLGNTLSMGTGTDGLQEVAWHLVMAEPDWVHGNNQQAIDRLDRGGQQGHVQADLLVVPGSLAEKILGTAVNKGQNVHKVLDRQM